MTAPLDPLIAIVGPTGSGKSELGVHLAESLGGEIIGCDSVQVYSGVNVGSAKLSPTERRGIPHHLLDVVAPDKKFTAGEYARLARRVVESITANSRLPLVVGGTGLYLRALTEGLSPAPPRDERFRDRLQQAVAHRPYVLHRFLRRFDTKSAERIHPNDRQKLTRAVEICHLSKQPVSAVHEIARDALAGFRIFKVGLNPSRELLYEKLNNRVNRMFENGLIEETRTLLDIYGGKDIEVMKSLGYLQAVRLLRRELSVEDAIAECQLKTRNYAKRQLTWFRADHSISWINGFGSDHKAKGIASERIRDFLFQSGKSQKKDGFFPTQTETFES